MDVLPWLILAAVAAMIGGVSWHGRRSEHRDEAHPERVRMPRYVVWIGIGGLPPLLLILLASPGSGDPAMTIVPLLLIGVFASLILIFVNWYPAPSTSARC